MMTALRLWAGSVFGNLVLVAGLLCFGSGAARAQGNGQAKVDSLSKVAVQLYKNGKYEEAIVVAQQQLSLAREALGEQHPDYNTSLNNLARLYYATGHYSQAEPLYQQVLVLTKQQLGEQDVAYATALNNLALLYEIMGYYFQAEPLYRQTLTLYKKLLGEQHSNYATTLNNLAGLYVSNGHYVQAEPLLQQALAIKKKQLGEYHRDYAASLGNLAFMYQIMGHYAQAEPLLQQMIGILKQVGEPQPYYATALQNLGALYYNMGRFAQAESLMQQTIAIRKQQLGEQHPDYATSLISLAILYEEERRFTQAEPLFQQGVAINKQQFGEHHPNYAASLDQLAGLYRIMGHYTQAESLFHQTLAIRKQQLGEQHSDYANSLSNLATVYFNTERYTEAEPLYQQALVIKEKQLGKQHPECATILSNLSALYSAMGRYSQAETYNARAIAIRQAQLRLNFTTLSEREKQQLLTSLSDAGAYRHSLLVAQLKTTNIPIGTAYTYDQLLFSKGMLLAATASIERQILASSDTALIRRFGRWQATKRQLAAARILPLVQQQRRGLDLTQLDQQANQLEKELAAKSAVFAKGAILPSATWQQVRHTLKSGEASIELVRYRWFGRKLTDTIYYSAYVVTSTCKTPQLVVLKNGNALESQYLPAYRHLTHAASPARGAVDANAAADSALANAKVLYQAFWQPIAQALPPGTKTVYLSADGVYQQLNLATLQNPATGKYVLEETDIRLMGSTRELVPASTATAAPKTGASVLVGAPAYRLGAGLPLAAAALKRDLPARSAYSRSEGLLPAGEIPPLLGTAREVAQLDSQFTAAKWPHHAFTGDQATEETIRDLHRPRMLHIATHGFFVPQADTKTVAGRELNTTEMAAETDPMLRSGLLLAGVSNFRDAQEKPATEDGILTAYEASLLDLQGTELVVLSACETGLGQVQNGEGVYGLQRGFTVAGAKSILMSLWKVNDAVTQELMVAFYQHWLGGQSKRAALLAAQQQVRKQHPEPYYWGAFVLVGE